MTDTPTSEISTLSLHDALPIFLKDILDEYDPDIFMVCELQNQYGAYLILNTALNYNGEKYMMAPFVPSQSGALDHQDRKSTRLNSSHVRISYAVFCLKKKKQSI